MGENEISYKIRGAIFNVFNAFGPELLESVYTKSLQELLHQGLRVRREVEVPVAYLGEKISEVGFRLDLLVEEKVILK